MSDEDLDDFKKVLAGMSKEYSPEDIWWYRPKAEPGPEKKKRAPRVPVQHNLNVNICPRCNLDRSNGTCQCK